MNTFSFISKLTFTVLSLCCLIVFNSNAQTTPKAADVLANARKIYSEEGPGKALPEFEKALALSREEGDRKNEAITIGLMGNAYKRLGQPTKALEFLERALAMKRELGDRLEEGRTLGNIGLFYWDTSNFAKAIDYLNQASIIAKELGNRNLEAAIHNNIGLVYDELGDPRSLEEFNQAIELYRGLPPSTGFSDALGNIGGWHSRPDFLNRSEPAVRALTTWLTWVVRQVIDTTAGFGAFKGTLSFSAWASICRNGAYHAPHSHPDSAWSGVDYVDAGTTNPNHARSGVLEFLDPRAGVEAVSAPGDPYGEPVRVYPESGLLVIFPSWLFHWVHPYAGESPRIAVSFNAALGPPQD